MDDRERGRRSRFARRLAGIGAGALAIRLAAVVAWYRHLPLGLTDNFFYWAQARAVAHGHGYLNPLHSGHVPSAAHPPLYTTYLALFSRVGLDTPTQFRIASCLLGTATVVVLGLTARRIAGDRAGLCAAAFAALFPPLWIADGTLVSETAYGFAVALALLAGHVFSQRHDTRSAALLGAAVGLATLGRTEGIGLVVLLVLPLTALARAVPWRGRVVLAGVAVAATLVTISPWVVRNLVQFDGRVYLTDSAGYVLTLGNCDETYSGAYLGYWLLRCEYKPPPGVDTVQGDIDARKQAVEYMKAHRSRVPVVVAARVGRLWNVYRVRQGLRFDVFYERRGRTATNLAVPATYLALGLSAFAAWALRRDPSTLVLLASTVLSATLAAATAFGVSRYRIAGDVGIALFAGVGFHLLLHRFRDRAPNPDARG